MKDTHTIAVIGLGYIGLPTAAAFADNGATVIGVDVSRRVIDAVNAGKVHIVEPGLDEIVQRVTSSGSLRAIMQPEPADSFIIAVPTPFKGDHQPDLHYVEQAIRSIAPVLRPGNLVILESTSPVGTTELVEGWIAEERPDLRLPRDAGDEADISLAYCPERILPGNALHELVANDRIIGGRNPASAARAQALYKRIVQGDCIATDARTAEMCKLTENSSRDVAIAFANELSVICDQMGIDVWQLIALANHHPRVNILQPGAGVGGHCIAVDPWFIIAGAPEAAHLIRTAREGNDAKPDWVLNKVKLAIAEHLSAHPGKAMADVSVVCMGLAFKPNIDDLRESPALAITRRVAALGVRCLAVEPNIYTLPDTLAQTGITLLDQDQALAQADIIVALVRHDPFAGLAAQVSGVQTLIDVVGLSRQG